ncbi:mitotic spindle assembly checkpoint protein MAD2B [Plodia interpunctella]|uniref:mitotic spindle assembly checkpoint protein MAD2B n=1 Tax=Plodia interpunctella TaxID=58824 RepID=UPI0023678A14|nr:mitotic spindle assembly checkpoint protein MAD2B [Plodia interpunctella]
MDPCFSEIMVEFLAVAFHNILYYASVYPRNIFETRKKYSIVIYHCVHPEIKQYIELCLKSASECLKAGKLHRILFSITNNDYKPLLKFVFDLSKNEEFNDTTDAYLVQAEQNLRAFCLKLSTMSDKFEGLPEDVSFAIHLHTTESTAVSLATNPDFEEFPLVEVDEMAKETDMIIPIRRFSIRKFKLDTYIEVQGT